MSNNQPLVIAVLNEKGGTGKSTVSTNLAIRAAQEPGADVLVVDADPAKYVTGTFEARAVQDASPPLSCISLGGRTLAAEVRKLRSRGYSTIVIDCAAGDGVGLRQALLVADVALIPILPGQYELESAEYMEGLIAEARGLNESLQAYCLLNKCDSNPRMRDARALADQLRDSLQEVQLLDASLCYRVAWRRSVAEGLAVNEAKDRDPRAAAELEALYGEIRERLQASKNA